MARSKQLHDDVLIPLLIRRSYHLPGNDWRQDWIQWFRNNHILLGICLHHRLHPLETWERYLLLMSSISFGLVATSLVYQLYDLFPNVMAMPIIAPETQLAALAAVFPTTRITVGAIVLWTVGGLVHGLFDMLLWHVMACACCHPGGQCYRPNRPNWCRNLGSLALIPVIVSLLGTALYLILLRAATTTQGEEEGYDWSDNNNNNRNDDEQKGGGDAYQEEELENIPWDDIQGLQSFSFLFKYAIELLLAWFIYFPIIGSLLFSGILGANGKIPILGGRPRDIERIRRELQESSTSTSSYRSL